jgi:hypothetical protein
MTGNVRQPRELPRLGRPLPLFCFFSHKLGRLLVPFAMLFALAAAAALRAHPLYRLAILAQLVLFLFVASGALIALQPKFLRLYHAPSGGRRMAWK